MSIVDGGSSLIMSGGDEDDGSVAQHDETLLLPGFRFHPTDEELISFYLKHKIQHKSLPVELIRQLDIYKFDPWELPELATMAGEKEWYFYCPRDRKYRNSARPNRVTGAGFWKATGTDRPIYSSNSSRCIGLKKSLVFYKGRAAKGIKTDWMMHEFRLASLTDVVIPASSLPVHRRALLDGSANDSWAICRIFKKTNATAQRAVLQPLAPSPLPAANARTNASLAPNGVLDAVLFDSCHHLLNLQQQQLNVDFSENFNPVTISGIDSVNISPARLAGLPAMPEQKYAVVNAATAAMTSACIDFGQQQQCGAVVSCPAGLLRGDDGALSDEWRPISFIWDSLPCAAELSTAGCFSAAKC